MTHTESATDILLPALNQLDIRSRTIIELRYGLYTYNRTLEEIGAELGLHREPVRRIEAATLKQLRASVGPALRNTLDREAAQANVPDRYRLPWLDLALTICEISTDNLLAVSS